MNRLLLMLCLVLCNSLSAAEQSLPHLHVEARLDLAQRALEVQATISVPSNSPPQTFDLADVAAVEPRQLAFASSPQAQIRKVTYRIPLAAPAALDHREVLADRTPMADERGSFIPAASLWYPALRDGLFTYRVTLATPPNQRALVPGKLLRETLDAKAYTATFAFDAPAQSIDLIAGPYVIEERMLDTASPIRLRTYFHAEIKQLAADYMDASVKFIERYARDIGPYPFTEFSIVSSPTPTGFGMPTLTYLGIDVLRLPFIRHTSLGHEVLHNWWGNGVYVQSEAGNWCEGLTAFMADYAYREQEGEGPARATRLAWLRDLSALPDDHTNALRDFRARIHGASQIVGYSKAAMVFQMLREHIGPEAFARALREFWRTQRFKLASWEELRKSFETASAKPLGTFFSQWLDRSDLPQLRIANAHTTAEKTLRVELQQAFPPYEMDVTLAVYGDDGMQRHQITLRDPVQNYNLQVPGAVKRVLLDPDLHLIRKLEEAELPAILRQVMIGKQVRLQVLEEDAAYAETARELAGKILDQAPITTDARPNPQSPLLLIGTPRRVDVALQDLGLRRPTQLAGRGSSQVWAAKRAAAAPILIISSADLIALQALLRPLPHYGSQSYLIFDGSKAIERGVWPYSPVEYFLK